MDSKSAVFAIKAEVGLHDTALLKRALDSLPGVTSVAVNRQDESVAVDYNGEKVTRTEIQNKIEILGYPIKAIREG